ncbi:MAG: HD domain-containing phosphohydrolase, partial [Dehalococcoidia bacterium]|nr:HD domain-containing phosphohydrolase [Dehalococcoidia bacterium]
KEIAERIRQRIAAEDFDGIGDQKIPLTVSIGVSSYTKEDSSPDALVQAADAALYVVKRAGGNAVRIHDPSIEITATKESASLDKLFRDASLGALQAVARAADAREATTRGHSTAVTGYVKHFGTALGLDGEDMKMLETAALLHDIGKIGITEAILSKPGSLTNTEWEIVQAHPVIGELLIKRMPSLPKTLLAILHHHERWDGNGYPDKLKGEEIPFFARLLTIADAYDAMTSTRPYRRALSKEQAVEELRKGAGSQFDPVLVKAFISLLAQGNLDKDQASESLDAVMSNGPQAVIDIDEDQNKAGSDDRDVKGTHAPA